MSPKPIVADSPAFRSSNLQSQMVTHETKVLPQAGPPVGSMSDQHQKSVARAETFSAHILSAHTHHTASPDGDGTIRCRTP
jgi:hypothetical protein